MFDLRKNWHYEIRASQEECEGAFCQAFEPDPVSLATILSPRPRAKWSVSRQAVEGDHGTVKKAVVSALEHPGFLRSTTREGRAGIGAKVAFAVDWERRGVTSCQLFLLDAPMIKANNITPAYIANGDILKRCFKKVHRNLVDLDPELNHAKAW